MNKRFLPLVGFVGILAVAGVVFFITGKNLQGSPAAVSDAAPGADGQFSDAQIRAIVAQVGKHLVLPEGETPTIASVLDADTLKAQQPFYKDVENGDYLLIYPNEARAILYNPKKDILVNVGAIQLPPPDTATSTATSTAAN